MALYKSIYLLTYLLLLYGAPGRFVLRRPTDRALYCIVCLQDKTKTAKTSHQTCHRDSPSRVLAYLGQR